MLLKYIFKRILVMIPTLFVTSVLIFTVINLPEGDYFETMVAEMQAQGEKADMSRVEFLKKEYGFDKPPIERYFWWVTGLLRGDMGTSTRYSVGTSIAAIIAQKAPLSAEMGLMSMALSLIMGIPLGAAMARSAGTFVQLMAKEGKYAILRLPSSEMRRVLLTCKATVGEVGNAEHSNIKIGKAGRNRWKGIRPTVRGTVMNPSDPPHGGGEGMNKSSGRHPVTPWGVPTKGHRTRNPKKASSRLIIRRRKK